MTFLRRPYLLATVLVCVSLGGCLVGCSASDTAYSISGVALGTSLTELTDGTQTREVQVQGVGRFQLAKLERRGWDSFDVTASSSGSTYTTSYINAVAFDASADRWSEILKALEAENGESQGRAEQRGRTIVWWGDVMLTEDESKYGSIDALYTCDGRVLVASFIQGLVQVEAVDNKYDHKKHH